MQSNSYCESVRSRQGGSGLPYNDFTTTSGIYTNQAPRKALDLSGPGYDKTINAPSQFGPFFTDFNTPCYSSYHDTSLGERQPMDFSSNAYASIGCHLQLDETQDIEGNLFTDPVFSQDLSIDVHTNPASIAVSQTDFEDHVIHFNTHLSADRPMPPTVLSANDYGNSPYYNISIPIIHTNRVLMPTNSITCSGSATDCFPTGTTILSNTSPSITSVDTTHLDRVSSLSNPQHNARSRITGTYISLPGPVASPGYTGNGRSSSSISVTEMPNPISKFPRLGQGTSSSLGSKKVLKPNQPQDTGNYGHHESLGVIPVKNPSSNRPVSVTGPGLERGFSKCPWEGCPTITTKRHHKSNMRNHVRTKHEKPAPPMCEICGIEFERHSNLKKHLRGKKTHCFPLVKSARTVRKIRADGKLYTTYQQVHDYVKDRTAKKA